MVAPDHKLKQRKTAQQSESTARLWRAWLFSAAALGLMTAGLAGLSVIGPQPWLQGILSLLVPAALAAGILITLGFLSHRHRTTLIKHGRALQAQRAAAERAKIAFQRMSRLYDSCQTLSYQPDLEAICNRLTQVCFESFDCDQVSFMMVRPKSKQLEVVSVVGKKDPEGLLGVTQEIGAGVAGWVAESRKSLLLGPDLKTEKFWQFQEKVDPIHAAMAVPVVLQNQIFGVLNVTRRSSETPYSQEDLKSLEAAAWFAAISMAPLLEGGPKELKAA